MADDKPAKKKDAPTVFPGGRPPPVVIPKSAMAKPIDPAPEPDHKVPKLPKRPD